MGLWLFNNPLVPGMKMVGEMYGYCSTTLMFRAAAANEINSLLCAKFGRKHTTTRNTKTTEEVCLKIPGNAK